MALTDAKKRSNNKWDAANMTVLGCKVRKDEAERFKAACKEQRTTVNAVFRVAMVRFMDADYTKLTDGELNTVQDAEKEMERGEFVSASAINWN